MAGRDPTNKLTSKTKSTFPRRNRWLKPAIRVKGTACAISVPITCNGGNFGYSTNNNAAQNAPAPTEESVTKTPKTIPTKKVI